MTEASDNDTSRDMARDRTDWAEDRTVLANERTFAGWMRTGLASVGIGLALQAVFKATEPTWAAKTVASVFIVVGILIFQAAWRNSCRTIKRLSVHSTEPVSGSQFSIIAALMATASGGVAVVLWLT